MVHGDGEQGESSAGHRSHKGVGGEGAVRVHQVDVDDVAQPLQKDQEYPCSDGYTGDGLRHPGDMRVRGPGEPEEADG